MDEKAVNSVHVVLDDPKVECERSHYLRRVIYFVLDVCMNYFRFSCHVYYVSLS